MPASPGGPQGHNEQVAIIGGSAWNTGDACKCIALTASLSMATELLVPRTRSASAAAEAAQEWPRKIRRGDSGLRGFTDIEDHFVQSWNMVSSVN
jgi:hypothetical protein